MSERSPRIEVPTSELFGAMDAELAQQAEALARADQQATEEQARQEAEARAKEAAALERAWRNPTVTAKFREREAGLVADTAEVRGVIHRSQVWLGNKERRSRSDALKSEGRVNTDDVVGIRGKVVHDTMGGFAREFAKSAVADTRHYADTGRKARHELNKSVSEAGAEKNLSRRIGTLKKELADAHDKQEDFRARMLEEKLTEAREELMVQRALTAERKAAEAKEAEKAHKATVRKGVKALESAEHRRTQSSQPNRSKIDQGTLAVLDGLNGHNGSTNGGTTNGTDKEGAGAAKPIEEHDKSRTAEVTGDAFQAPEAPDTELQGLTDDQWSEKVLAEIAGLLKKGSLTITEHDMPDILDGLDVAVEGRANTRAEFDYVVAAAVRTIAEKRSREAEAALVKSYEPAPQDSPVPDDKEGEAADSPEVSGNKLTVRSGFAEKALKGEDSSLVDEDTGVYGVFDGLGGYKGGDVASRNARNAIQGYFASQYDPITLDQALAQMRGAFRAARLVVPDGGAEGLTTAAVARVVDIEGQKYLIAGNAGDSRIILERSGVLSSVTREQGSGNEVENCFGETERGVRDEFTYVALAEGDRLLICSDGITGDWKHQLLSDEEWADAFGRADPQTSAQRFIEVSKKHDDKTAIVLFIEGQGIAGSGIPQGHGNENPVVVPGATEAPSSPVVPPVVLPALQSGSQKKRFTRVRDWLAEAKTRSNNRVVDAWGMLSRRKGRVSLGAGALAVAVGFGVYLAIKNGTSGHEVAHITAMPSGSTGNTLNAAGGFVAPPAGGGANPVETAKDMAEKVAAELTRRAAEKAEQASQILTIHTGEGGTHTQAVSELASNLGIKGSHQQIGQLYNHIAEEFRGDFFTEAGESYLRGPGDYGVNAAGTYHYRPEVAEALLRKALELGMDIDDEKKNLLGL